MAQFTMKMLIIRNIHRSLRKPDIILLKGIVGTKIQSRRHYSNKECTISNQNYIQIHVIHKKDRHPVYNKLKQTFNNYYEQV